MAIGSIVPTFGCVITVPDTFADGTRSKRVHDKAVKLALESALMEYWRGGFRDHFTAPVVNKYRYAIRADGYKAIKKKEFRSITDLVRTGRTKNWMTTARPRFTIARGSVEGVARSKSGTGVTGRLTMKFPFPATSKDLGKRNDGKRKISPADMAKELATWAESAMWHAANVFAESY